MQFLTKNEFQDALQKGLGRAVFHVRSSDRQEVQDDILHACLHNLAYDPQMEGDRSRYLFALIELTKNESFFREPILENLMKDISYSWDEYHLLTLARQFAQNGDEQAREVLYVKLKHHAEIERQAKPEQLQVIESWMASEQIVALDGLEGWLYVVEVLGARLSNNPESFENDNMLNEAYDQFGKEIVLSALSKEAETNPHIRDYLDKVVNRNTQEDHPIRVPSKRQRELTLEKIMDQIETDADKGPFRNSRFIYTRFGHQASDEDIEHLYSKLLAETRRAQLLRYLRVFRSRAVPRLENRLFELAISTDDELQRAAVTALANTRDSRVRKFALAHLKKEPRLACQGAVRLLIKNYQIGDSNSIETILSVCADIDNIHALGIDLLQLAEAQSELELANCIGWVYEKTPCSYCRERAVGMLIDWGLASESILRECLWDANDETRDLAKEALSRADA